VLRVYFVSDLSAGLTINKQRNGIPPLIAYAGSQTLYTMFETFHLLTRGKTETQKRPQRKEPDTSPSEKNGEKYKT
jgi:hypothetical protein